MIPQLFTEEFLSLALSGWRKIWHPLLLMMPMESMKNLKLAVKPWRITWNVNFMKWSLFYFANFHWLQKSPQEKTKSLKLKIELKIYWTFILTEISNWTFWQIGIAAAEEKYCLCGFYKLFRISTYLKLIYMQVPFLFIHFDKAPILLNFFCVFMCGNILDKFGFSSKLYFLHFWMICGYYICNMCVSTFLIMLFVQQYSSST